MTAIVLVSVINHYHINRLHLFWDTLYIEEYGSLFFVWCWEIRTDTKKLAFGFVYTFNLKKIGKGHSIKPSWALRMGLHRATCFIVHFLDSVEVVGCYHYELSESFHILYQIGSRYFHILHAFEREMRILKVGSHLPLTACLILTMRTFRFFLRC